MPWLTDNLSPWMTRILRKLTLGRLKECLQSIHPSTQPLFKASSKQSCWHAILRHLKQRGCFPFCQAYIYVLNQLLCAAPFTHVNLDSRTSFMHNDKCRIRERSWRSYINKILYPPGSRTPIRRMGLQHSPNIALMNAEEVTYDLNLYNIESVVFYDKIPGNGMESRE
jgi:hypothetical protein